MITKIKAVIATVLLLGSTSMASAASIVAAKHHPTHNHEMLLEDRSASPTRTLGSYGGYSSDPHTRALEILSDEYPPGW